MSKKIIPLQRTSIRQMINDLTEFERREDFHGAVAIMASKDGRARFRIAGFDGPSQSFYMLGLLDWIKADLLLDLVAGAGEAGEEK